MSTTAQSIIDQAELILMDSSNTHWGEDELLAWLNYGQKVIVREKPDANTVKEAVNLSSGIWQTLPADRLFLIDVTDNMGTDGSTRGSPITVVDRKWIDTALPTWTTEDAATTVKNVVYDPKTQPKAYAVYPQSDGTNYIEIVCSSIPSDVAAIGNNINLDDEYAEALMDYILARAFSKDADYVENAQRAQQHWSYFLMAIGKMDMNELDLNPKRGQGAN